MSHMRLSPYKTANRKGSARTDSWRESIYSILSLSISPLYINPADMLFLKYLLSFYALVSLTARKIRGYTRTILRKTNL
jgi:hypothetical protein